VESDKIAINELKTNDIVSYRNDDGLPMTGKVVDVKDEFHPGFKKGDNEFQGHTTTTVTIKTNRGSTCDEITSGANRVYREVSPCKPR